MLTLSTGTTPTPILPIFRAVIEYPARWLAHAAQFREEMNDKGFCKPISATARIRRNRLDLFMPWRDLNGLVVFVHGGYWMEDFDKSAWSHLAKGALAHGFAVAVPSYALCPEVRVSDITVQVGLAITSRCKRSSGANPSDGTFCGRTSGRPHGDVDIASEPSGPAAHPQDGADLPSSRSASADETEMNKTLHLDAVEARLESPALLEPQEGVEVTAWVGAAERPEFLRQNLCLQISGRGLIAVSMRSKELGKHHANIIEGLMEPDHPLTRRLVCACNRLKLAQTKSCQRWDFALAAFWIRFINLVDFRRLGASSLQLSLHCSEGRAHEQCVPVCQDLNSDRFRLFRFRGMSDHMQRPDPRWNIRIVREMLLQYLYHWQAPWKLLLAMNSRWRFVHRFAPNVKGLVNKSEGRTYTSIAHDQAFYDASQKT